MDAKEKWIHDTENSLKGLQRAEVNPYLYSKIRNRLNTSKLEIVPGRLIWLASASLLLLLLLNLVAVNTLKHTDHRGSGELQALSREMQLINTNPINY